VNVGAIVALDGDIGTTTKPTIGFSDFIGAGGEANEAALVTQKVCVQEFNDLFARVYELDRENSNLTANGVKSLKDYQNMLLTDTDFDHKKEQPLLEALSGLVDFLIIPEFFKAAIGYDPITDEFLTDQERQNLVIDGCIQTALLGAGIGTDLVASAAEKAAAKAAAIEVRAVVGDEVLIKSGVVMGDAVTGDAITGEAVAGDEVLIGREGAAAEGISIKGGTDSVKYYRVQGGGTGNQTSQFRISINPDGSISIPNKKADLNISAYDLEHAQYFRDTARAGGEIVEFQVPKHLDDLIKENLVDQYGYTKNPLSQGGTAPKLVDPTTPGTSYELPSSPWLDWLEEYGHSSKIID
jgi:hypothetical protein